MNSTAAPELLKEAMLGYHRQVRPALPDSLGQERDKGNECVCVTCLIYLLTPSLKVSVLLAPLAAISHVCDGAADLFKEKQPIRQEARWTARAHFFSLFSFLFPFSYLPKMAAREI